MASEDDRAGAGAVASEQGESDDVRRILAAAWAALGTAGYENLKIQSVIRRAGVSTGSFYRRFSDKEELMLALGIEEARRNARVLRERTTGGTPTERVLGWVSAFAELAFHDRARARTRWFSRLPLEVLTQMQRLADEDPSADTAAALRQAIADGVTTGEFAHAEPASDAAAIFALCNRVVAGNTHRLGESPERVAANLGRFALAALTNPHPRFPDLPPD
jgi:AcrR family transcriptional regulator